MGERAKLKLKKRASKERVRAGGKVRFGLTVRNRGDAAARKVRLCDRLPRRLTVVKRDGGKPVKGTRICWRLRRIPPGEKKRRSLVVRVDRGTPKGRLVNRATARAEDLRRRRAKASVRVRPVREQERPPAEPSPVTG